jgi:hypothetical protein
MPSSEKHIEASVTANADSLAADFRAKSLSQLETLFMQPAPLAYPVPGNYAGKWLKRIENAGTYKPFNLISQWLMFEIMPFGITFQNDNTGIWYFFNPALAAGNFVMKNGASMWRDTKAVALNYETAKLPGFVRGILYDEIKPLSENHALGIGGFKGPAGDGDNFFFLLTRV